MSPTDKTVAATRRTLKPSSLEHSTLQCLLKTKALTACDTVE